MDQAKQNAQIIEQHLRDRNLELRMNLLQLSLASLEKGGRGEFTFEQVVEGANKYLAFIKEDTKASKIIS